MESIICKLICVTFAVVSVSAVNRDQDLMTILAKERQEMREMFKREAALLHEQTARLDEEDKRQQKENLKLKEQIDKLQQQDQKLKEENVKLRQESQNDKLKEQIVKLRRENKKLRRADVEIKQTIRQRDQNNSLEVTKMKKFIRQDDVHSELKKIIRNEINDFLIVEKMCVSGISSSSQSGGKSTDNKVEFGHTFPRKPTVLASLYYVYNNGGKGGASTYVQSVSNSSAVIRLDTQYGNYKIDAAFAWLACL